MGDGHGKGSLMVHITATCAHFGSWAVIGKPALNCVLCMVCWPFTWSEHGNSDCQIQQPPTTSELCQMSCCSSYRESTMLIISWIRTCIWIIVNIIIPITNTCKYIQMNSAAHESGWCVLKQYRIAWICSFCTWGFCTIYVPYQYPMASNTWGVWEEDKIFFIWLHGYHTPPKQTWCSEPIHRHKYL